MAVDEQVLSPAYPTVDGPGREPDLVLPSPTCDPLVRVGDVVDVLDGQLSEWWRVVPHREADAMRRCISEESPLARALLGRGVGEVVRVRAPGAPPAGREVTILSVRRLGQR